MDLFDVLIQNRGVNKRGLFTVAQLERARNNFVARLARACSLCSTPRYVMDLTEAKDGGVMKEVTKEGTGELPAAGMKCELEYTGKLDNGKVFDSGDISFPLGAGHVIKGWDMGVAGMKVGGERKLVIPPALAYGAAGTPGGPIPPNARLTFDVKLLNVD